MLSVLRSARNCIGDPRAIDTGGSVGRYSGGSMKLGYVPGSSTENDVMNAPVKMGPIGRPETPVRNYRCTLRNIPEDAFERIEEFEYLGTA
jgi:hypothetical protein